MTGYVKPDEDGSVTLHLLAGAKELRKQKLSMTACGRKIVGWEI